MYRCRPSKWILPAIVGAGLPFLAGWYLSTPSMTAKVTDCATTSLKSLGADSWAKVALDGRDVTLTGESPDQAGLDAAVKAVAGSCGVRSVATAATVMPPLPMPEVAPIDVASASTQISGKWPEGQATELTVSVNDKAYELGKAPELSSNTGNWVLKFPTPLPPGDYTGVVRISDGKRPAIELPPFKWSVAAPVVEAPKVEEPKVVEAPKVELPKIDAIEMGPLPAVPTVSALTTIDGSAKITGTWDAKGGAERLRVAIPALGITARANQANSGLTTDGDKWTYAPATPLPPGTYEVVATSTDKHFRTQVDTTSSEILIRPKAKAPTVKSVNSSSAVSTVSGTWDSAVSKRLRVRVPALGESAKLGDSNLTVDGNTWTLGLKSPAEAGRYEVLVTTSDEGYVPATDSSSNEIVVFAKAPEALKIITPAAAPTVRSVNSSNPVEMVSGTWDAVNARKLNVSIPTLSESANLGDSNLTTEGNNWTLALKSPAQAGRYEVVATSADEGDVATTDSSTNEIVVFAKAPPAKVIVPAAAPTVMSVNSSNPVEMISGTWDSTNARKLNVSVPSLSESANLGDSNLKTDGNMWMLTLKAPAQAGRYEVVATSADEGDVSTTDSSTNEIVVFAKAPPAMEPPPPPTPEPVLVVAPKPAPAPAKIDCVATFNKLRTLFPIRFVKNKTDLEQPYSTYVNQYIALLKDPRCVDLKVSMSGHADKRGSVAYNQGLSNGRVVTVIRTMLQGGVGAGRLRGEGFSELQPLDPADGEEPWAKNRRVDINLQ